MLSRHQPVADLGGDSVGDVGLHGGDVLLWVVNGDEKVVGFRRGVGVRSVWIKVIVQLQPVEEHGRRSRARRLDRRAVGQPRLLRGQITTPT